MYIYILPSIKIGGGRDNNVHLLPITNNVHICKYVHQRWVVRRGKYRRDIKREEIFLRKESMLNPKLLFSF